MAPSKERAAARPDALGINQSYVQWLARAVSSLIFVVPNDGRKTMKTEFNAMTGAGWNGPFWFAVLSPVFGILVGFLALLFLYN